MCHGSLKLREAYHQHTFEIRKTLFFATNCDLCHTTRGFEPRAWCTSACILNILYMNKGEGGRGGQTVIVHNNQTYLQWRWNKPRGTQPEWLQSVKQSHSSFRDTEHVSIYGSKERWRKRIERVPLRLWRSSQRSGWGEDGRGRRSRLCRNHEARPEEIEFLDYCSSSFPFPFHFNPSQTHWNWEMFEMKEECGWQLRVEERAKRERVNGEWEAVSGRSDDTCFQDLTCQLTLNRCPDFVAMLRIHHAS